MYFAGWIFLVGLGLWASIGLFIWAFRSGQFSDQGRARYLPLSDLERPAPPRLPARLLWDRVALWGVVVAGMGSIGTVLAMIFWGGKG
jgi:cbb3-type cytochrome oxidase maturation protein